MRKLPCLVAAAALSGLFLAAGPASASPLAGGLASGITTVPTLSDDGLVQKVHRRHCSRKYGWYRGKKRWHRHCRRHDGYAYRSYYYDPYYYDPYYYEPYYYRRSYGFGFPFIGFQFGRRHHHWDWD